MRIFNFKKKEESETTPLQFEREIVSITNNGIIDTTSPVAIEKFKHNLKLLVSNAKERGILFKFFLIREDEELPVDYKWQVLSKYTSLESVCLTLSKELAIECGLEKLGIKKNIDGINIPLTIEEEQNALKEVNLKDYAIYLPSRFRSTKHFTINTPLGVTGDYNNVSVNRNFIIIDDINLFLNSGYGYSLSYHDAYLDVSHESLDVSPKATILINKDKYEMLIKDSKSASELAKRRVVLFKGDESLAINMFLVENGVLPSRVGYKYIEYDEEVRSILDRSIKSLADDNNLLYDQSHAHHFTTYFDELNNDYNVALNEFVLFLKHKFLEHSNLFSINSIKDSYACEKIISTIGTKKLLMAILEYNENALKEFKVRNSKYSLDRSNITPETSYIFKETVKRIKEYYLDNEGYQELDELVVRFYQSDTVEGQLDASKELLSILDEKRIVK